MEDEAQFSMTLVNSLSHLSHFKAVIPTVRLFYCITIVLLTALLVVSAVSRSVAEHRLGLTDIRLAACQYQLMIGVFKSFKVHTTGWTLSLAVQ